MLKLEEIYNVTVAKDGQEAYDIVKAGFDEGKAYDLIIMDIQVRLQSGIVSYSMLTRADAKFGWPTKHTSYS
jgi:osomolarity two-component system, sensor histidine kinase SLN1